MSKERLDVRMVREGFAPSREKAKELIQNGQVQSDGKVIRKAGTMVEESAVILVSGGEQRYVSRGGLKLEKALETFAFDLREKTCIDAGASTGGFTDCMLQNGAKHVYAVDVGHDQLAQVLREDVRVTSLEGVNVRYLSEKEIPEFCDFVSVDVSFISLIKVLPALMKRLTSDGELICLVKPQFEAGRALVGKKGVVKDASIHADVLERVIIWCLAEGLTFKGLTFSPVRGPEGNIEYLLYLGTQKGDAELEWKQQILDVVRKSHEEL